MDPNQLRQRWLKTIAHVSSEGTVTLRKSCMLYLNAAMFKYRGFFYVGGKSHIN